MCATVYMFPVNCSVSVNGSQGIVPFVTTRKKKTKSWLSSESHRAAKKITLSVQHRSNSQDAVSNAPAEPHEHLSNELPLERRLGCYIAISHLGLYNTAVVDDNVTM